MHVSWDLGDDGQLALASLTGFSVAILPQALLAMQLRCVLGDVPGERSFQFGMTADAACELAAGLLAAAEIMRSTPDGNRLN